MTVPNKCPLCDQKFRKSDDIIFTRDEGLKIHEECEIYLEQKE